MYTTKEHERLKEVGSDPVPPWMKWGPYVSERSWGTVREDYSADGNAWDFFPHDLAISKAYRWGEDGIAGWSDRYQVLCFSPAFWNGKDPILKERLFGLNAWEGNHGEDVKEYYYHLDATPTHSYMKYLYKYPQGEFPYQLLREENQKKGAGDPEYELVDTGIFAENRYFDIFVEYAKTSFEDLSIRIEVFNRGKESAPLHLLPQLWYRNQWAWGKERLTSPKIHKGSNGCLIADDSAMNSPDNLLFDYHLGQRYLYGEKGAQFLFTENETRTAQEGGNFKDSFHRVIIHKERPNNLKQGTKACFHYFFPQIAPGKSVVILMRFTNTAMKEPLKDVEEIIAKRREEADAFYGSIHPEHATVEEKKIQRQAISSLIWNKQIYLFDVNLWLKGDNPDFPPPEERNYMRNVHWRHLNSMRILCMPDKWEYSWFAAWDQAFHCIAMALVDIEFAKEQLWLLLFDQFQHPNGAIPACEWEFSDLNPPVQAWVAFYLYSMEEKKWGKRDRNFLEKCFHKLLMNFSWWVNKVDNAGYNVFEGGFLGLDNITVLDRSQKLPGGVRLQQSDGTGWMAMFCLNLMKIALELAKEDNVYESLATKFFQHFVYIAHAMKKRGNQKYELWSERDGFFYDVLTYPDGKFAKFRVRSLVGIIPFYAVETLESCEMERYPEFHKNFIWFQKNRPHLVEHCVVPIKQNNQKERYLFTVMEKSQLNSVLKYIWNPQEFRAQFGLRSLSKFHEKNPFVFEEKKVAYEPAESLNKVKGGNSNWRGPIWMPTNFLLIDALKKFAQAFKGSVKIGAEGEQEVDLEMMARSFADRLIALFANDAKGERPFFGPHFPFKRDPHWKDHLFFHEYFNPETGQGCGACQQAGWTALVANLIDEFRR